MAHSIEEAIMCREFSKRQRPILDLIIRLSWGCGKKYAYIPRMSDFEIVGIGRNHIRGELRELVTKRVIMWDEGRMIFWFNKHFEQWAVPVVKHHDNDRFKMLLSLNLNDSQNGNSEEIDSSQNGNSIPETGTLIPNTGNEEFPKREPSSQNGNKKFPKQELSPPSNPQEISDLGASKEKKERDLIDSHLAIRGGVGGNPDPPAGCLDEPIKSPSQRIKDTLRSITLHPFVGPLDEKNVSLALEIADGDADLIVSEMKRQEAVYNEAESKKPEKLRKRIKCMAYFIDGLRDAVLSRDGAVTRSGTSPPAPVPERDPYDGYDAATNRVLSMFEGRTANVRSTETG
jgi:hypothetical protein